MRKLRLDLRKFQQKIGTISILFVNREISGDLGWKIVEQRELWHQNDKWQKSQETNE